jgi:hypothetical protein
MLVDVVFQTFDMFITINASEKDPKYQTFEKPHLQAYFNNYPEPVRQILDCFTLLI